MEPSSDIKEIKISEILIAVCAGVIIFTLLLTIYNVFMNDSNITNISRADDKIKNISVEELDANKFTEDYIYVNTSNLKLITYKNGEKVKEYNIVTIGKPGSYYETPTGNYEVLAKMGDKLSSLGDVYMPNSIQFWGNFFIHGIPYYKDGTKVSSTYSGGCIRLSDADSKEVYDFAKRGTRVIIINNNIEANKDIDYGVTLSDKLFTILISLDVYNQEKMVMYNDKYIKNLKLIEYALSGDENAYNKIKGNLGSRLEDLKIQKAKALGIADYTFASTSDRITLSNYIATNKSYLSNFISK